MDLIFRLNPDLEGFEDRDATDKFFLRTIPEKNNYYFFDTGKNLKLDRNDTIYFSWRNQIVSSAVFQGEVIENPDIHDRFRYGYRLSDIKLHYSNNRLNKDIVSSWTAYIKNEEIRAEVNRVLFSLGADFYVDEDNESLYLEAVRRSEALESFQEIPRKPVPPKPFMGGVRYKRNPQFAAQALRSANYKCEIDSRHQTFISEVSRQNFTEAHHLIPLSCYQLFLENDLDTVSNIVSLCPNCHKKIHLGSPGDRDELIEKLFKSRLRQYERLGIVITLNQLKEVYSRRRAE